MHTYICIWEVPPIVRTLDSLHPCRGFVPPDRSLAPGRKGCYGGRSMDHGWYGDLAMIIGYHRCCLWRYQRNGGFYRKNIHERANFPWPCLITGGYTLSYLQTEWHGVLSRRVTITGKLQPMVKLEEENSLGDGSKWCTKKHFLSIDIVKWG